MKGEILNERGTPADRAIQMLRVYCQNPQYFKRVESSELEDLLGQSNLEDCSDISIQDISSDHYCSFKTLDGKYFSLTISRNKYSLVEITDPNSIKDIDEAGGYLTPAMMTELIRSRVEEGRGKVFEV